MKLLPRESETTRRWSAVSWAPDRSGWLFLTSTPETRTRLVPLTSLWLDMLVLRLMNRGQPGHRAVWFVLDELASLQRLPQLHTAVTETENRTTRWCSDFRAAASSKRGTAMMPRRYCRSPRRRSFSAPASRMPRSGSRTRSVRSRSSGCARAAQKASTANGATASNDKWSPWCLSVDATLTQVAVERYPPVERQSPGSSTFPVGLRASASAR